METELNTLTTRRTLNYAINGRYNRALLATHLKQVIKIAFNDLHPQSILRDELDDLNEAIGLLAKERPGTLIVRKKDIQQSIHYFLELMEEVRLYSTQSTWPHQERKLRRALSNFTTKLNKQTNIRLSRKESDLLAEIKVIGVKPFFIINLIKISPHFHIAFEGKDYITDETHTNLTLHHQREALLAPFPTELSAAYREVESLLREARPIAISAEDGHFVEQVSVDYYPHIFKALQQVTHEITDLSQKEAVVIESLKQFNIIQLGLNKIIDENIARNLSGMKSQTDFLRNKVMGSQALSFSPAELELTVGANVAEVQKMREELYLKHVAPQIEQCQQSYEAKLTAMRTEHEAELKSVSVQNWKYKADIAKLEAEVEELKYKLDFQRPSVTDNPTMRRRQPPATIDVSPKGAR